MPLFDIVQAATKVKRTPKDRYAGQELQQIYDAIYVAMQNEVTVKATFCMAKLYPILKPMIKMMLRDYIKEVIFF